MRIPGNIWELIVKQYVNASSVRWSKEQPLSTPVATLPFSRMLLFFSDKIQIKVQVSGMLFSDLTESGANRLESGAEGASEASKSVLACINSSILI